MNIYPSFFLICILVSGINCIFQEERNSSYLSSELKDINKSLCYYKTIKHCIKGEISKNRSLGSNSIPFDVCGDNNIFNISSIQGNNWPPKSGSTETIIISGISSSVITEGNYQAEIKFDYIPIYNTKGNLSELSSLPIQSGNVVSLTKSFSVPGSIQGIFDSVALWAPGGRLDIKITAQDQNGNDLICINITGKSF